MGVGSYFEKLIANLGKDLEKKERFAQDYTEHLIRNKPLSEEARDMGSEIGMANLTVTPHTKLFRGILESLAGLRSKPAFTRPEARSEAIRNVLYGDPVKKERAKDLLTNIDRNLAEKIKVTSPDVLSSTTRGRIERVMPGMSDDDFGHLLWKIAKEGADIPPEMYYKLMLKPLSQGGKWKTVGHELEHILDTELKYAPTEMLEREAGNVRKYRNRISGIKSSSDAAVTKPVEGNAEYMGRLRILGERDPFVNLMRTVFPRYSGASTKRYAQEVENAMRYRQWKADKIKTYRESIAAQKSSMPAAEAKKAEKTLHQMGLFPYEKLPVQGKVSRVDEVLKRILGE